MAEEGSPDPLASFHRIELPPSRDIKAPPVAMGGFDLTCTLTYVPDTCGCTCTGVRPVYCPKGAVVGRSGSSSLGAQQATCLLSTRKNTLPKLPLEVRPRSGNVRGPHDPPLLPGLAHQSCPTRVSLCTPSWTGKEAARPEARSLAAHPNPLGSFNSPHPGPSSQTNRSGVSGRGPSRGEGEWLEFQVPPVPQQHHPGTLQRHRRGGLCSPRMSLGCGTELLATCLGIKPP